MTQGSTLTKADETMVLYSGECSFKFKFRLIGIERLNVLFKEMSNFVATENKDTKPRNVQLDNKEAVNKLPDDDGRLTKMAMWIKKKLGMRQTEGNDESAAKGQLSKYLVRSISVHESMKEVPSFQAEKEKQKASRDLLKSFHVPLGVASSGNKDSDKKKGKKKGKEQVE